MARLTTINYRLKSAIAAVGTQAEVAKLAGIDPATLSAWVRQRNKPSLSKLERVARVVGKPVSELYEP